MFKTILLVYPVTIHPKKHFKCRINRTVFEIQQVIDKPVPFLIQSRGCNLEDTDCMKVQDTCPAKGHQVVLQS